MRMLTVLRPCHSHVKLLLAALFALNLGACSSDPDPAGWDALNPGNWSNKRETDDALVFDLSGPISVDVVSFAGDVVIEADSRLTRGEVTFVREARHGFGRKKDAKASLGDITASAEITAADTTRGELGQTLRIRTESTNPELYLQRAHVYVRAPAIDGVFVHTDDGNVTARHIEGAVDIESSNGTVSVRTNLVMTKPVTIINRNGDVIYRAARDSTGKFDVQTISGRASADIRFGTLHLDGVTRDDLFKATLNNGTNPVTLRTTNGDIKVGVLAENEKTVILPSGRKPPKEEPIVPESEPAPQE
jgi:hypothetical protein